MVLVLERLGRDAVLPLDQLFDPGAPEVTDPQAAGGVSGRVLAGRRVLLVVDDVWSTAQVEPFLVGGDAAASSTVVRLFTTRQPGVLPVAPGFRPPIR